jgi:hypothetical protein
MTFVLLLERVGQNRNEETDFKIKEDLKRHLYDNFPLYQVEIKVNKDFLEFKNTF